MKRITLICCAVLISTTLFAVSKPSLDGRAVVADEGILPRGLFAKTVGYLPGDSVSVTNPATGVTINVLVLGSLDPSSGVAILLSPEAADKIHSKAIEASNFTERMSSDAMNHRFTYMDESGAMQNYKYEYTDPTTGAKSLRNVTNDEEMSLALSQQKALSGKLNARDKKVDAELKRTGQSRSYRDTTRIPNDKDTSPFNQAITDKYLAYRQSRRYSKEKGPDTYKDPLAPNKYATGYDIKTHY